MASVLEAAGLIDLLTSGEQQIIRNSPPLMLFFAIFGLAERHKSRNKAAMQTRFRLNLSGHVNLDIKHL